MLQSLRMLIYLHDINQNPITFDFGSQMGSKPLSSPVYNPANQLLAYLSCFYPISLEGDQSVTPLMLWE